MGLGSHRALPPPRGSPERPLLSQPCFTSGKWPREATSPGVVRIKRANLYRKSAPAPHDSGRKKVHMFVISVFSLVALTSHDGFWVRVSFSRRPPPGRDRPPSLLPIAGLVIIASAFRRRALGYGFRDIISFHLLRWVLVPRPLLR